MALIENLKNYTAVAGTLTEGKLEIERHGLVLRGRAFGGGQVWMEARQITPAAEVLDAVIKNPNGASIGRIRFINPMFGILPGQILIVDSNATGNMIISSEILPVINHFALQ